MVSLQAFLLAAALAGSNDTVLLHFTADWCGPCRLMEPTIQRLRDAGYPLRDVNVDQESDLTRQFRVGPIPCCVLVRGGREVDRVVGQASFDRLARMFEPPKDAGTPRGQLVGPSAPNMRGQSPDDHALPMARLPESACQSRAMCPCHHGRHPPALQAREQSDREQSDSRFQFNNRHLRPQFA